MFSTKLKSRLQQDGMKRAAQRAVSGMWFRLLEMRPSRRRMRRLRMEENLAFDRRHGVDTATRETLKDPLRADPLLYGPIEEGVFRDAMARLPIRHEDFSFLDLGSGKGKALFLAAEHPFADITGVEFSHDLHAVAERNIARFNNPRGPRIRSVCADASTYEIPSRNIVLFLFNPFGPAVMSPLIENIAKWREKCDGDMWVVYVRPHHAALWSASGRVDVLHDDGGCAIYKVQPCRQGIAVASA